MREKCPAGTRPIICLHLGAQTASELLRVGGDEKPRDSGGERRIFEAPPGAGGDIGAYGPTTSARRSRSGIKKLFAEAKRKICRTSKLRARKSRKHVDHQKEADFNPHQHHESTEGLRTDRRLYARRRDAGPSGAGGKRRKLIAPRDRNLQLFRN